MKWATPHSILTNALTASAGRVFNVAAGLVATALIARVLGPGTYGLYAALLSYGTIVQLLADAGLYLTLTREIARHPAAERTIIRHTVTLRLALLAAAFILGALLVPLLYSTAVFTPYIWLAAGLAAQSLSQLYMGVFQHHQQVWRATVGDLVGRAVQIAALGTLALNQQLSLGTSVGAFAAGALIAFAVHQYIRPGLPPARAAAPTTWGRLLRSSWPLGLMLVLNAIYFRLDLIMVSVLASETSAGLYGIAYRIIESTLFFPAMLGGLLLPRLSESWAQGDHARTRQFVEEGLKVAVVLAGAAAVALVTARHGIVTLVAGAAYVPAAGLLGLLSIAAVIMFIGNIIGFALVALERQKALLALYAFLVVFNAAANALVIPRWAATGAALTTIATEMIAAGAATLILVRALRFTVPVSYGLRAALAAAVALAAGALLPTALPSLARGAMSLALFAALAGFLGLYAVRHRRLLMTARPAAPSPAPEAPSAV